MVLRLWFLPIRGDLGVEAPLEEEATDLALGLVGSWTVVRVRRLDWALVKGLEKSLRLSWKRA